MFWGIIKYWKIKHKLSLFGKKEKGSLKKIDFAIMEKNRNCKGLIIIENKEELKLKHNLSSPIHINQKRN